MIKWLRSVLSLFTRKQVKQQIKEPLKFQDYYYPGLLLDNFAGVWFTHDKKWAKANMSRCYEYTYTWTHLPTGKTGERKLYLDGCQSQTWIEVLALLYSFNMGSEDWKYRLKRKP